MNIEAARNKVLNVARTEIGYHESGDNIIKYAQDNWDNQFYGWELQGQPWCDVFVDYCFCKAFGNVKGAAMTYQILGSGSAACKYSASFYQTHGAYYQYPEVGDQVFFYYNGDINHTGIVESVTSSGSSWSSITTIEGNTSDMVARRNYTRGSSVIAGFGRPNWGLVADSDTQEEPKEDIPSVEPESECDSPEFKAGDLVSIVRGATYYNSAIVVPPFVLQDNWIILQVQGDRAVINYNQDHTRTIMSPISTSYLKLVNSQTESDSEPIQDEQNSNVESENNSIKTYTVKKGDTLWGIAQKTLGSGVKYYQIKSANNLKNDVIYPGQILIIP